MKICLYVSNHFKLYTCFKLIGLCRHLLIPTNITTRNVAEYIYCMSASRGYIAYLPVLILSHHINLCTTKLRKPTIMPSHHSNPSNAVKTFKRHQWSSNSSRVQTTLENIHYSLRNASMFRYCCCGLF